MLGEEDQPLYKRWIDANASRNGLSLASQSSVLWTLQSLFTKCDDNP
jgi:hypothetical protein